MRQTAERAVSELCGDNLSFQVLGNAPLSFYQFKYPKGYQATTDRVGAKVFIFKAYLTSGFLDPVKVVPGGPVLDYQWATLEELEQALPRKMFRAVSNMLHSDD